MFSIKTIGIISQAMAKRIHISCRIGNRNVLRVLGSGDHVQIQTEILLGIFNPDLLPTPPFRFLPFIMVHVSVCRCIVCCPFDNASFQIQGSG